MDYWKNKVVVVTGASSGIGAAISISLANAGLKVIGLARRKNRIEELSKLTSGHIHAIQCDISKTDSILTAFKEICQLYGSVHILVNNAGRNVTGRILDNELPHEEILKSIDVNVSGLVVCTREAYKLMQNHTDYCYIVNMNSIVGHITPQIALNFSNIYGATKTAVTNHTETVRLDLAASPDSNRIRVTVSKLS